MTEANSVAPEARVATLDLREAVFTRAGAALIGPLSVHAHARRIGLIGDWEPLFSALTGTAGVASGSARIFGCDLESALARGVVGFAPCDPPLPVAFSVREYLEHSARLCHGSRARAGAEAQRMLEELELVDLARLSLAQLVPHQTRALGIAVAALTAPAVVCLESPLCGLDSASADYITRLCAHVAQRHVLIVSGAWPQSPSPERALFEACDDLVHLANGTLVAEGSPAAVFKPSARYLLTLAGPQHSALASALTSAGCELRRQTAPTTFSALLAPDRAVSRYLVDLPATSSSDLLLEAALATGATVLELEPLAS